MTAASVAAGRPSASAPVDLGLWLKRSLRLLMAGAISGAITYAIGQVLYGPLDVRTDIVGYPIFADFNVGNYRLTYVLWVAVFPMLVLGAYTAIGRLVTRSSTPTHLLTQPVAPRDVTVPAWLVEARRLLPTMGRAAVVGASFGALGAITVAPRVGVSPMTTGIVCVVGYVLLVPLVASGVRRVDLLRSVVPGSSLEAKTSVLNACLTPLAIVGLAVVSHDTRVVVGRATHVYSFTWFPWWLAVLVTLVVLAIVVRGVRRAGDDDAISRLELRTILMVTGPVLVILLTASLPGVLLAIDAFHEGEVLVAGRLLEAGYVPWSDFIGVHGPLQDGIVPLVGFELLQDSRWGVAAVEVLVFTPLYWLALYALNVRLLRRSWPVLVATFVLLAAGRTFASGLFATSLVRLALLPLITLAFARLLQSPSRWSAAIFTVLLAAQIVLTGEAAAALPAFAVVLVAYELVHASSPRFRPRNFPRTTWFVIFGFVVSAVLLAVLASLGAASDFLEFFTTFARGHDLTGGLPIQWDLGGGIQVTAVGVPILLVVCFWYVVARVRARRPLEIDDWALGGLAVFVAAYYLKGLSRGDAGHFAQPWIVGLPLLFYVVARALSALDVAALRTRFGTAIARGATTRPVSVVALIVLVALAWSSVSDEVDRAPERFTAAAPTTPVGGRVGFIAPEADPTPMIDDLDRFFDAVGAGDADVFDFSNSPAIFYYLRDGSSPTRYYHVSSAIRAESQDELIDELKDADPPFVVFDSKRTGLPSWDGIPNTIRHYDVSSYLLEHYRPIARVAGFTIFARQGRDVDLSTLSPAEFEFPYVGDPAQLTYPACDWGHVPEHLDASPDAGAAEVEITEAPVSRRRRTDVVLPAEPARYGWIALSAREGIAPGRISLEADGTTVFSLVVGDDQPKHLWVQVASCPQWRDVSGGPAVLVAERPQRLTARLVE